MLSLKKLNIALLAVGGLCYSSAYAASSLVSLTDDELAKETGQALMSLSYIAPTDTQNLMGSSANVGFYKLGLEATMQLNANIKNLQLGCGGVNNTSYGVGCDIDIKNLSLSGLPDSYDANGSPVYSSRASTDATITNPFIQFAIKNPDSASTRQVVGLQLGAAAITGLLSAGTSNSATPSTTDGIQSLSGFMQVASTTGQVTTAAGLFGKQSNESFRGNLTVIGLINDAFTTLPSDSKTTGITIPSEAVGFTTPAFTVNGQRQNTAYINGIPVTVSNIPLDTNLDNDRLYVQLDQSILGTSNATVKLHSGSKLTNLNLSANFAESLSMIHNIPLQGTGGYLSLQSQQLIWPGSTVAASDVGKTNLSTMSSGTDVAQPGWWMSFAQPVNLGNLVGANPVDISSVYPQIATLITQNLTSGNNTISLGLAGAFQALTNSTVEVPNALTVDLNSATNPAAGGTPVSIALSNLQLKNQTIVPNCYGTLTFC